MLAEQSEKAKQPYRFDPKVLAKLELAHITSKSFEHYHDTQALLLFSQFNIPLNMAFLMAGFSGSLFELDYEKDKEQRTRILTSYHHLLSAYSGLNYDWKIVGKLNSEIPSLFYDKEAWTNNLSQMISLTYSIPVEDLKVSSELNYEAYELNFKNQEDVSDERVALIESKLNQSYELLLQAIEKKYSN